jgi:hypothetical protein
MGDLPPSPKQRPQSGERLMNQSDVETLTQAGVVEGLDGLG